MMGVALFLVWKRGIQKKLIREGILIYSIQLVLNALWSILFFGLKSPLAGFIEIIILWIFITVTLILFFRISKVAGFLLLPYLGWVTFAAVLNGAILTLN
jgi:tryptophan-rich sensory protein